MRRLFVLLVAAATLALTACASPPAPLGDPSQSARTQVALPALDIVRTGGFAGVNETLSIDSSGAWSGPRGDGQLSVTARTRLAQILADPALPGQVAAAPTGGCCDMFQYALEVGDRTYAFGEPELGPLLVELLDLLRQETGF